MPIPALLINPPKYLEVQTALLEKNTVFFLLFKPQIHCKQSKQIKRHETSMLYILVIYTRKQVSTIVHGRAN